MGCYIDGVEACQYMADYVNSCGLHDYVKFSGGKWWIENEFGHCGPFETEQEAKARCDNYCGSSGNPTDIYRGKTVTDGWGNEL